MFEALGLNSLTESVYLAMLRFPDAGVSDLTRTLAVDEDQVRAALDDLARMALLRTPASGTETPRPVNPKVGLSALLARKEAEVARRRQEIEETRVAFTALLAQQSDTRSRMSEDGVERVEGIDEIRERLRELAATCEWEACSFIPGGAQSEASLTASRELDADAIERGVRLRTIYLDSVRNDQPTFEYAQWLAGLGSEVRTVPTLPLRMLIVDRKLALVPVDTENSAALAVEVSNRGVLTGLVALFNSVWKTSVPLGVTRRRDDEGLSPQEKQVLRLLGEGHTDEMIARRMGVSVRTARRVASTLLTRLNAQSRFQAGARAVAKGWIDPEDLG
ncbi:LuxR C-terminal-related transcriptional regulator [Sphaerisporangium sp. NPDC051011]|uniref:LuxR C-terminal-related transcriptional regulator n=1 Tax=Sphaerisporangium sp. NPDC051011 TaxID=3155792 RepID=UPI0033C0F277